MREIETYKTAPTGWPIARVKEGAWAQKQPRSVAVVTGVTMHVTGVRGGFGVSPKLLARFNGDRSAARLYRYSTGWGVRAYHAIASPAEQASIIKLEAEVLSHHGHGLNRFTLGWAYDGLARALDDLDVPLARASLAHTIRDALEQGCPIRKIYAHRQSGEPRKRAGDPGPIIWSRVAEPVARELDLEIDYEWTTGPGLPIPASWRERPPELAVKPEPASPVGRLLAILGKRPS